MKYLLVILFCCFQSFAQTSWDNKKGLKFFNKERQEVSKKEFRKGIDGKAHLVRALDEEKNHMHVVEREEHGQISNRKPLDSLLSKATERVIIPSKPLVIVYYPGPDPCNESGTTSKSHLRAWWKGLNKGLDKMVGTTAINIAKTQEGLSRYKGVIDWYNDPNGLIEELFFEYHYPCSSFTVVAPNGKYISYFGEFGPNTILKAVEVLEAVSKTSD